MTAMVVDRLDELLGSGPYGTTGPRRDDCQARRRLEPGTYAYGKQIGLRAANASRSSIEITSLTKPGSPVIAAAGRKRERVGLLVRPSARKRLKIDVVCAGLDLHDAAPVSTAMDHRPLVRGRIPLAGSGQCYVAACGL